MTPTAVIPAQAGTHVTICHSWVKMIAAVATTKVISPFVLLMLAVSPGLRRDDGVNL
jgi:hypothetical protein